MAKTKRKTKVKGKKKVWFNIFAPKAFNEQLLAQSPCYEKEELVGKNITTSMMALTRDMKKQSINIKFEVVGLKGDNAFTRVIGYNVAPSSIKRMMRRNKDKIAESFSVLTKDNLKVRMKPILITRSSSSKATRTALRQELRNILALHCKSVDFEVLTTDVMFNKLQKLVKEKLHKIHPISISEIRLLQLESEKATVASA